jgi:hypothetical protein
MLELKTRRVSSWMIQDGVLCVSEHALLRLRLRHWWSRPVYAFYAFDVFYHSSMRSMRSMCSITVLCVLCVLCVLLGCVRCVLSQFYAFYAFDVFCHSSMRSMRSMCSVTVLCVLCVKFDVFYHSAIYAIVHSCKWTARVTVVPRNPPRIERIERYHWVKQVTVWAWTRDAVRSGGHRVSLGGPTRW